jgi:hypothetical protein
MNEFDWSIIQAGVEMALCTVLSKALLEKGAWR